MKSIYFCRREFEFRMPDYYNKGNYNKSLLAIEFPYGTANGYERRFMFTLIQPRAWGWGKSTHNGHARFYFGCGLFTISFDWLDKKSIINHNEP